MVYTHVVTLIMTVGTPPSVVAFLAVTLALGLTAAAWAGWGWRRSLQENARLQKTIEEQRLTLLIYHRKQTTSVLQGMSNKKSHFELAQKASECRERLKKAYGGSRVVRHIKSGGHYILLDVVFIEANVEPSVLYRPYPSGPAFVRPLEEFLQKFDTDPPRKQGLVVGG